MLESVGLAEGGLYHNRVIAIIPARAGSKRLRNKNIKNFKGLPLIEWTIIAAKKSGVFTDIVITTDSEEIIEIGEKYSCICHRRSEKLATDRAATADVVTDILEKYSNYDDFILLQPTSPLRTSTDIHKAYTSYLETAVSSLVSVTLNEHSPLWSCTLNHDNTMKFVKGYEALSRRSQDLPSYYRLNGAIYIHNVDSFRRVPLFIGEGTKAYEMSAERSIDIDTEFDFRLASLIYDEISSVS